MRDKRFRAWDKEENRWVAARSLEELRLHDLVNPGQLIFNQHTGLRDKNGVEIYEGYIVQYIPWGMVSPVKDIIKWDNEYHGYRLDPPVPGHGWEVIGNVHENPELIK